MDFPSAVALVLFGIFGCSSPETSDPTPNELVEKENLPGSDRDAHGCIGSAGYAWSELCQNCIRPFELPLQLQSISSDVAASASMAGVIFASYSAEAEVFSKEWSGGKRLVRVSKNRWTAEAVFLESGPFRLRFEGHEAYRE
ncbi:hypothetical protein GC167_02595 [bacterium]|nr:hypothetical protein [bacterium]